MTHSVNNILSTKVRSIIILLILCMTSVQGAWAAISGTGTKADPFVISSADDLATFRTNVNNGNSYSGQYVALGADINLSGVTFTPIGSLTSTDANIFKGTFDGKGHTISDMSITCNPSGTQHFGLFSTLGSGATVQNLIINNATLTNSSITNSGNLYVGVLAGYMIQTTTVNNVVVQNSSITSTYTAPNWNYSPSLYIGGLAVCATPNGENGYNISNAYCNVNITVSYDRIWMMGVAGLVAYSNQYGGSANISNVFVEGSISSQSAYSIYGGSYVNSSNVYTNVTGASSQGTSKTADFKSEFMELVNSSIEDNEDLMSWTTNGNSFSMSALRLKLSDTEASSGKNKLGQTHTFTVTGADKQYTYVWKVGSTTLESTATSTGSTCTLVPVSYKGENVTITVKDGDEAVTTLTTSCPVAKFNGSGTSDDPYQISNGDELAMMSYIINHAPYSDYTTAYSSAYYELQNDIDISSITNFEPIGAINTSDTYNADHCFQGHFDGKGFTISGLKQTWLAGDVNTNGYYRVWGLFGAVQGTSDNSLAVIQNLVISGATLTHDTSNSSFTYSGTSNNNHCFVGVLAGVVGQYSTIQNIEVRGSSITDASTTSSYTRASGYAFCVGGVIGRVQLNYNTWSGDLSNTNITLTRLSSHCDITISKVAATDDYRFINVAGIVGSMESKTSGDNIPWPTYTYYTGKMNVIGKAFVSPVFSYAKHSNNTGYDNATYCYNWTGKSSSGYNPELANIYYGTGYQIYYSSAYNDITADYPSNKCGNSARTLVAHTDNSGNSYSGYEFQGVNWGTYVPEADRTTTAAAFNDAMGKCSYTWSFSEDQLQFQKDKSVVVVDDNKNDGTSKDHVLEASVYGYTGAYTIHWYKNDTEDTSAQGATSYTVTPGYKPQYIYAQVTTDVTEDTRTSDEITIPGTVNIKAVISKDYTGKILTVAVTPADLTSNGYTVTYQWYKGSEDASAAISGATSAVYKVTGDADDVYYCKVTVKDNSLSGDYQTSKAQVYDLSISSGMNAVYLDFNKETSGDGTTAKTAVNSWADAYAKLKYGPNAKRLKEAWAASKDDNIKALASNSNIKDVTDFSGSVDNNIIYLVGDVSEDQINSLTQIANLDGSNNLQYYTSTYATSMGQVLSSGYMKPVTISGKYANIKYEEETQSEPKEITYTDVWSGSYGMSWSDRTQISSDYIKNAKVGNKLYFTAQITNTSDCAIEPMWDWGVMDKAYFSGSNGETVTTSCVVTSGIINAAKAGQLYIHGSGATLTKVQLSNESAAASTTEAGIAEITYPTDAKNTLNEDTKFEYVRFKGANSGNYLQMLCGYYDLEMGTGVQMSNMTGVSNNSTTDTGCAPSASVPHFQIFGGFLNDTRFSDVPDNIRNFKKFLPHGAEGFKIKIKSGYYSTICVGGKQHGIDSRSQNGMMGSPDAPIKCTIDVDIDRAYNDAHNTPIGSGTVADYDIGAILAGNHEGSMFGDVDIIIRSGRVSRVVNGTLGALRTVTNNNVTYPNDSYFGRANILVDPASSENNTDTDIDNRVIITELYGGGLGRLHEDRDKNTNLTCQTYFYGKSTVTINGGKFQISDIASDALKAETQIATGIYASGAGGVNGIGDNSDHHTNDAKLPYWNSDKSQVLYGDWSTYTTNFDNRVKVECLNSDGTPTTVDPYETSTAITINGGKFGSATKDVDGIFGGGYGYVNTRLINYESDSRTPNVQAGSIFGKSGSIASSLTINGGEIYGNVYGASRGTDIYYNAGSSEKSVGFNKGTDYNSSLAVVTGNVVLNIDSAAIIHGSVFGAGKGCAYTGNVLKDMARIYGDCTVNISGNAQISGDIYGGGENGSVTGNVTVNISDNAKVGLETPTETQLTEGTAGGNIYGGGLGSLGASNAITSSADVTGNTKVTVDNLIYASNTSENTTPYLYNIYGGGNKVSVVGGNTNVNVATVLSKYGQTSVYGGGYGEKTSCKNAYVTVNPATYVNTGTYGLGNVFGGGNLGVVTGFASVTLKGGNVLGDVFGGGNLAQVGTAATGEQLTANTAARKTWASNNGAQVIMMDKSAYVWGNIYGGGNAANVEGNTYVELTAGNFASDVFAGGNGVLNDNNTVNTSADITNNATVYTKGAVVVWKKKWTGNTYDANTTRISTPGSMVEWDGVWGTANYDKFLDVTNYTQQHPVFLTAHNVYGGGNKACVVGGMDSLVVQNGFADESLVTTQIWKDAFDDNEHPHFYVFGGGYGAYTKAKSTYVTVNVLGEYDEWNAEVDDNLAKQGMGFDATDISSRSKISNGLRKASLTDAGGNDDESMGVYDNVYGIPGFTVLGVLGGGYGGIVEDNTNVVVTGNTYVHRVYGGGYGSLTEYNKLTTDPDIFTSPTTIKRKDLGMVYGNTNVKVPGAYVYGDVFGGGAGVESTDPSNTNETDRANFTDFEDMAKVYGKTYVTVSDSAEIFGSVYGGGDIANVAPKADVDTTSTVKVTGGVIYQDVFAGGSGRTYSECKDYTKLGNITGKTKAEINGGQVWRNVYGGCAYGDVKGDANVVINGGEIGNDIFGAGYGALGSAADGSDNTSADVTGNTTVTVKGGAYLWRSIADADGNKKGMTDDYNTRVALTDILAYRSGKTTALDKYKEYASDIFDFNKKLFIGYKDTTTVNGNQVISDLYRDHNTYGGGNTCSTVGTYTTSNNTTTLTSNTGKATVIINHGMYTDNLVPERSGSRYAYADDSYWSMGALCSYLLLGNTEHPQFSVLGGGYGVNTKVGSTEVTVNIGGTEWTTTLGTLMSEYNALSDNIKDTYYGGTDGDYGSTRYVLSRMEKILSVPGNNLIYVVGGGMAGSVTGNTAVTISGNSMCYGVFGGGIGIQPTVTLADQAKADELTYGQVGGDAVVNIDNGIVRNDVFGGGAGIASLKVDGSGKILEDQTQTGTYRDFPNIARILGKTKVTVGGNHNSMAIYGHVYGGGDVANVGSASATTPAAWTSAITGTDDTNTYVSDVTITGGNIMQQVFAGGNGRVTAKCSNYTKLGAIYGNARVILKNNGATGDDATEPYLWNRLYGGGQNGTIYGNANVQILDGYLGYNVFGGGWGDVDSTAVKAGKATTPVLTSADIKGATNINVAGGTWVVSQIWQPETNTWAPMNKDDEGNYYSAQYNYATNKFLINHNIYGGGNAACEVGGDAFVKMTQGLLDDNTPLGHSYTGSFFAQQEWKAIYNKVGTSHFAIYGGGYGENTKVQNTHVDINMTGTTHEISSADSETDGSLKSDLSSVFYGNQSLMDVFGGGYSGTVMGATNVNIGGNTYLRRAFGGSYYADVSQANMTITSVNADDIFGGGQMGDVQKVTDTSVDDANCGVVNLTVGQTSADNSKIFINKNIYGGNDVSGAIHGQINLNVYGGKVYGNIYGAGNGNYLYAFTDNDKQKRVIPNEDYTKEVDGGTKVYDQVVYVVPALTMNYNPSDYFITGLAAATGSAKLINIAQFRPQAAKANINIQGNSTTDKLTVLGSVFGGGNTATIAKVGSTEAAVTMNIGSHVDLGGVYMGSDGKALFDDTNNFMTDFCTINGISGDDNDLNATLDWVHDSHIANTSTSYVPVEKEERSSVYKTNLDLYFMPVEMSVQPTLTWAGKTAGTDPGTDLTDCTIGTFVCGGNRGNMNVEPSSDGNIVDYIFPQGLTIKNRIVGGCNEANYTIQSTGTKHEGGYLLGERSNGSHSYTKPAINLLVQCAFQKPTGEVTTWTEGMNVYGGCYKSGTIRGDVNVDFRSTMLSDMTDTQIRSLADSAEVKAIGSVYGAGYGTDSYVYGNTKVYVGKPINGTGGSGSSSKSSISSNNLTDDATEKESVAAMSVYGGGQEGNVIGNSFIQILNGHIGKDVVGGSYAGNLWGSTHVLVGYPKYYKCNTTGIYNLFRTDKWNAGETNADGTKVVKDKIYVLKDDYISQDTYDAITKYNSSQTSNSQFTGVESKPTDIDASLNWNSIDIYVKEAVYGGGYSVLGGASGSGNYTVKKFDDDENMDASYSAQQLGETFRDNNSSTKGYGGNTTVLVWDRVQTGSENGYVSGNDHDHITISNQQMQKVTLANGTDLFNYYYKDASGNYRYIFQEGKYKYGDKISGSEGEDTEVYTPIYSYDGEGGIYGDGHMSFAEGFRAGDMKGYGFASSKPNGAKIMNTIQRMDMIRVTDCAMVLLGARDYTVNELSTTPYSIARVGELYMYAENVKTAEGGKLNAITEPKSRNYIGLSNNIHYIGAVRSNVSMDDDYHDKEGKKGTSTYRTVKQGYIDNYYGTSDATDTNKKGVFAEFQKRNDATAINMIGISSGYALKVQNVKTIDSDEATTTDEEIFWGPIVGVVEMNLLNVRTGEAGGYVYADNIHHRKTTKTDTDVPAAAEGAEDFLETSGNFVFPYDSEAARYIVDDCFNNGYDDNTKTVNSVTGVPTDDAHYWYVTGTDYYMSAHITGYTNTAKDNVFSIDNSDDVMRLSGTEQGTPVTLRSITWRSNHSIDPKTGETITYSCDLQDRNTSTAETAPKDASGSSVVNGYKLWIGSATKNTKLSDDDYVGVLYNSTEATGQLFAADGATPAALKNMTSGFVIGGSTTTGDVTTYNTPTKGDEDHILIEVHDNVDNSTTEYYNDHLSKSCLATIVLTAPQYETKTVDGVTTKTQKTGYVQTSEFYTYDATNGYKLYNGTITLANCSTYYYKHGGEYRQLNTTNNKIAVYVNSANAYVELGALTSDQLTEIGSSTTKTSFTSGGSQGYGIWTQLVNTYNIYLTIDYIQGPNVTGNIRVDNCALPGEYIKLSPNDVKVQADVSMAQNGAYWRIGNKVTTENSVDKLTYPYYEYDQYAKKMYYITDADTKKETTLLGSIIQNVENNKTNVYIPAYYFLNGYKVQYAYTVNTIKDYFTAPLLNTNALLVHNYHRMLPRQNGSVKNIDLHIDLAAQRHAEELDAADAMEDGDAKTAAIKAVLPEPRVYLYDDRDLNAFGAYVDSVKEVTAENAATGTKTNSYGKNTQFFLMNNITATKGNPSAGNYLDSYLKVMANDFYGTFNGMGHVISGLLTGATTDAGSLFKVNHGQVYNLGVQTGLITAGDKSDTDDNKYHCCYVSLPNGTGKGGAYIYRMNGTTYTGYTDNDWRYGKVAYDLNQYYLDARYASHEDDSSNPRNPSANSYTSKSAAASYVENLYSNGDYLYAYQYDATTAPEYLRTQSSSDAHYLADDYSTWHNTDHTIDQARALGYVAAKKAVYYTQAEIDAAVEGDDAYGKTTSDVKTAAQAESCSGYQPLLNQENVSGGVTFGVVESKYRNDYLFFGQTLAAASGSDNLGTLASTIPTVIAGGGSHTINQFSNRVFRAGGYYRSVKNAGYYYNQAAYVHDNNITAIDFYGWNNDEYTNKYGEGDDDASHIGETTEGTTYYAPVKDFGLSSVSGVADGVTQNLLVYAALATDITSNSGALFPYKYDESKVESAIRMHTIAPPASGATLQNSAADRTTDYLHLVERTAKDKNGEGDECTNNDFCAPFSFSVLQRAWYTRNPYRAEASNSGYAESSNDAWEGICLPFTVNKVEASKNGEITHFYGTAGNSDEMEEGSTTEVDPSKNYHTLHHEYWLRGLTAVGDGTGTSAGKTVGTFSRPGSSIPDGESASSLFVNDTQTSAKIASYSYSNTFFYDTYEYDSYNGTPTYNNWYTTAGTHIYTDYLPLTADIPYIVSFPGSRYYEFDLSNSFYNETLVELESRKLSPQTVTFNAFANGYGGDETSTNRAAGSITVNATVALNTTLNPAKTGDPSYTHSGTYLSTTDASYVLNDEGTAFAGNTTGTATVLPFRTYMSQSASGSSKGIPSVANAAVTNGTQYAKGTIFIGCNAADETLQSEFSDDPQQGVTTVDGLTIYAQDHKVIVKSTYDTTLMVYGIGGGLVRVLDVRSGTNTYSGFQQGAYIVGVKKLYVK